MNVNRLTEKAREAVLAAQEIAQDHNHQQVDAEHLLLALLDQDGGLTPELLRRMGVDPGELRRRVVAEIERTPKVYGGGQLYMAQRLSAVLRAAKEEAKRLKDEYVSTEHLLLALVDAQDAPAGRLL